MPDEKEEKKTKEKKQEITIEVTLGITNETPTVYSDNSNEVNWINTACQYDLEWTKTGQEFDGETKPITPLNILTIDENGNLVPTNVYVSSELCSPAVTYNETVTIQYKYDYQNLFDINIQKQQKRDPEQICASMKDFIIENIDKNPEAVAIAIATLQTRSYSYYDYGTNNILKASGFTRKDLGHTSEEVLEKIYNTPEGEMLEGFVCSTISDFVMRLLHECNVEAVMLAGGGNTSSDHTTLVFKASDGNYVYVDENECAVIKAPNIKATVKALHRNNIAQGDFGYIMIIDEKNSYQEFDLQDETIWGHELDKRDYNRTYAQLPDIDNNSSIKANYNRSVLGGNEINLTGTYVKNIDKNTVLQQKISLGYKDNYFSNLEGGIMPGMYAFNSLGVKYEKDSLTEKENNAVSYKSNKTILNTTNIYNPMQKYTKYNAFNVEYHDYDAESIEAAQTMLDESFNSQLQYLQEGTEEDIYNKYFKLDAADHVEEEKVRKNTDRNSFRNFMLFNRSERGTQTPINDNLSTTGQISSTVGLNLRPFDGLVFCGDMRLTAEQSLNYKKNFRNSELKADINGGIVADMSIKTGVLKPCIAFGGKGNADVSIMTKVNDKMAVGANTSSYVVVTPVSTDYGTTGGVTVNYKNKDYAIFGNVNAGIEKQKLHIGLINEQTENNIGWNALLGVSNKRGSLQVGYSDKINIINPTHNKNMFTLGVNVNL